MSEIHVMGQAKPVKLICPACLRVMDPREDGRIRMHTNPSDDVVCPRSGELWDPVGVDVEERSPVFGVEYDGQQPEEAGPLLGVNVFRAADRVRARMEEGIAGNFRSCWTSGLYGPDVEALLVFVERHRRG